MSLFSAQLRVDTGNRGLGFMVLGASLHDVTTRLKAEPQRFPKLDVIYSPEKPVTSPVCIGLPQNGLRLRFDGPEQRLRLIEVLDFTKNHITFEGKDVVRPADGSAGPLSPNPDGNSSSPGPSFKYIYKRLLGPTFGGEFIAPAAGQETGTYVLSYPGVAFNFPLAASEYSPNKDVMALLSSSSATSMAIFHGDTWAQARPMLWTAVLPSVKVSSVVARSKDSSPDEVSLIRVHGGGKLELFRKWTSHTFEVQLGETTPQDLVRELGPPSAIYRKNDEKMIIHKKRAASNARSRPSVGDINRPEDLTDTDHSSLHTGSDDSEDEAAVDEFTNNAAGECFYNYFYLGFDVLLSTPVPPSDPPTADLERSAAESKIKAHTPDRLVATKFIIHGNIPGSYEFNRHRRCRWEISYLDDGNAGPVSSESPFPEIEERLGQKWGPLITNTQQSLPQQRGMVLNRGWGDSPGSSCELLGGWEESGMKRIGATGDLLSNLYGFPGLVLEVLKNGFVNTLTVF